MQQKRMNGADILICDDKTSLIQHAARHVIGKLLESLAHRDLAYMAISGGSTPKPLYEQLGRTKEVDFSRVHVCFVDERNVPPNDPQSNYGMVRAAWFKNGNVPDANIHRIKGELPAAAAAQQYETELRALNMPQQQGFPRFDLVLLGMGDDGHTASLFPDTAGLRERSHWVTANHVPKLNTDRITLTYPVINHARNIAFLIADTSKAAPVADVLHGKSSLPSAGVKPVDGSLVWLLDQAAASNL